MNEIIIKIFRRSFVAWAGLGFLLLIVSLSGGGGRGASLRVHLQVELSFPGLSLLHLLLMV